MIIVVVIVIHHSFVSSRSISQIATKHPETGLGQLFGYRKNRGESHLTSIQQMASIPLNFQLNTLQGEPDATFTLAWTIASHRGISL